MYKYTSKKDDVLGQMAHADQRHVQLRELLHASKMQPITGHDGAEPLTVLCTHRPRLETELIGTPRELNPAGPGLELPRAYSDDARNSIMRVARRAHLRAEAFEESNYSFQARINLDLIGKQAHFSNWKA